MLNKSKVQFDPESHTYTLGGVALSGVTALLGRTIFADKYNSVPASVLEKAAERGHYIHECCELVDELGVTSECEEANNYIRLCRENRFVVETSEYLISDEKHYASAIDKVFIDGADTYSLGDIKTTYKPDVDYVKWQLSIYAYLFELQNPGKKVNRLFMIYLRGQEAKIIDVERIDSAVIIDLMSADLEGRPFVNPLAKPKSTLPQKYTEMEDTIADIIRRKKEADDAYDQLKEGIFKEMVASGEYSWAGDVISVTRKKDTIQKRFDSKKFKEDHPDLYEEYMKESPVVGSITIKI